jgi:hypothetical protein
MNTDRLLLYDGKDNIMEYHGSATTTAMIVTDVDGRVRGGLMVVCEFAGKEFSPEGGRRCKKYQKHSFKLDTCRFYRKDLNGGCDCGEE